jgi:MYXO-CTERM domain-containing protein
MRKISLLHVLWGPSALILLGAVVARTAGPIGYWKFDDTAAPAVDAISGSNGTWNGAITPSQDVPAPLNKTAGNPVVSCGSYQISIANAPSYVQMPKVANLNTVQDASFSLACWYKPTSLPPASGTNSQYGIIMKAGWNEGISYNSNGQFAFYHWFGGDASVNPIVAPTNIASNSFGSTFTTLNTWYHLAGVVDMTVSPSQVLMYVNGSLVGSAGTFTGATFNLYDNEPWNVGIAAPGSAGAQYQADGLFDDVRIYDRALSAAEVTSLATGQTVGDPAVTPPTAPTGLTATASTTGLSIQLNWGAVTGATSYNIKRSTTSGTETQYAVSATNSYTDTGVTWGTTYFYEVTSLGSCSESAASTEANATTLPPPPKNPTKSRTCGCASVETPAGPWFLVLVAVLALLMAARPAIRRSI